MCRITRISFFAAIYFIGVAYGTECSSQPDNKPPIDCPGLLDSTKSYCCENGGSFHCCDGEEFALQRVYDDNANPLTLPRHKRDYLARDWTSYSNDLTDAEAGLSAVVIIAICLATIIPVGLICCCCCCCACCPCYHWCHPNTNVTIVQPSFGYPGGNAPANIGITMPNPPGMPQDPPPHYARGGYSKLSAPSDHESNYIQ